MQFQRNGELERAKNLYLGVLQEQPDNVDALHLYGLACHQQGDHNTAIEYIEKAVRLMPAQPVLRNNLGDALHRAGQLEAALEQLQKALELQPAYAGAHQNLGAVFSAMGEYEHALRHSSEAVRLDPDKPEAWCDHGLVLLGHAQLEEAADAFRTALKLRPAYPKVANSLLYVLNLLPDADPCDIAAEHCSVAAQVYGEVPVDLPAQATGKPIRIGFMSGDFCAHAVNYFFEPLMEHLDRSLFDTWCYSDVVHADDVTRRLQHYTQHWCDIAGWSDDRVIARVRADQLDMLVDLAGYTEHNRLAVFAGRSAACQVTWLGFPNTSGLPAMDYRIVDGFTVPASNAPSGAEKLLRPAPVFACFRPPAHAPEVSSAPFAEKGFITFGSLHKLEKINHRVVSLWADVLRANPGSKLLLARDQLDSWQQQRLHRQFASHGIEGEQLEMRRLTDPSDSFFSLFADIDILLDTHPWSGHTLACCALWMGVPVVSLITNSHAGRMVASVLHQLGRDEWVALDEGRYVEIATELGRDRNGLAGIRAGLRDCLKQSVLLDEPGFTRGFENAIRAVV